MTTKDKYIQKLEELIELWHFYADEIDAEDYRKIKQLESELSSLKAEMEKQEPQKSAEEIRNICINTELYIQNDPNYKACIVSGHFAERFDPLVNSIASQFNRTEVTDEEIKNYFTSQHFDNKNGHHYRVNKDRIYGAKAMRDGKIKSKQ